MSIEHENAYPDLERDLTFYPLGVDSPGRLTPAEIDQYNAEGYLAPFDIFDSDEIDRIREYFDDLLERALAAGWDNYEMTNWHKTCAGVWDLVSHPRIVDIVADLVGETVICRHSHFFAKLPGDGKRVSWHQDASYWPITPSKVVTLWLAIDDSFVENGAMSVIPKSHRRAQIPFLESAPEEQNVLRQTVPNPDRHGDQPVALELRAGQASLHSDWILHGSEPNTSSKRRCGLALRYLSKDVRAYDGWNAHSVVCRGVEPTGHWANHPRPSGNQIPVRD